MRKAKQELTGSQNRKVTHVKNFKSLLAEVTLSPSKKGIAGDISTAFVFE